MLAESVDSEKVVEIRKLMERGQEILPMGKYMNIKDVAEMKKIAQQLEDFEKNGSETAKNEIFAIQE